MVQHNRDKAKKEFDIDNETELRILREKWKRRDPMGRTIKPYFFGHIDKTKGYYNSDKKNYMKHDTSMDYLREVINGYRAPKLTEEQIPLTSILCDAYSHASENRKQIKTILYKIEQFKKTSYYIWSGYAETNDQYQKYVEMEDLLINEINTMSINPSTMYGLIRRIELDEYINICDFVLKILFNIGNSAAFDLIQQSQEPVSIIEESPDGDIEVYGIKFKKIQKMADSFTENQS